MKLIGGNISDTPIKDVSDGSAFSAGGGGATPKTLSVATTATSISGWTDKPWTSAFDFTLQGSPAYCKLDDSKWIFVWRSIDDDTVKAAVITFDGNNDPTFGSQTSLTAFTTSAKGAVWVARVSATRVLVMSAVVISTYLTYEIQVYDISGTTITAASGLSLQSVAIASANYSQGVSVGFILVIDENRAILSTRDYYRDGNNDIRNYYYGIRFTATQNVGSVVDFGVANGSDRHPILISTSKFQIANADGVSTIDISAASTPVLSNLVVVNSGANSFPFGYISYEDVRKLRALPDSPTEVTEQFGMSASHFGHYSGVSDNTKTLYLPNQSLSSFSSSAFMKDTTFMLLSQSDTVHYCLYSKGTSAGGLNTRYYQPCVIDTSNDQVGWGKDSYLPTGINSDNTGLLGAIIRPNASATRLTVFEYQTAATAGWYYATIDVA